MVEQGTHDELLRAGSLYAAMWQEQSIDTGLTEEEEVDRLQAEVDELRVEREQAIIAEHEASQPIKDT